MGDGRRRPDLRPGICVWMRPGGIYDAGSCAKDPVRFIFLHFSSSVTPAQEYFHHINLNLLETMSMRIIDSVGYPTGRVPGVSAEATPADITLLRACLLELCRSDKPRDLAPQPDWEIQEVAVKMRSRPGDDRSIRQWAQELSLTPAHFSRRFRKETGLSPQQYRIRARIASAQQLLLESSLSVTQIADQLGYPDVFTFSRQFSKFVGCSPTRYCSEPAAE